MALAKAQTLLLVKLGTVHSLLKPKRVHWAELDKPGHYRFVLSPHCQFCKFHRHSGCERLDDDVLILK